MTLVALIICLLTSAFGALGIASPSRLLGVVRYFQTPVGLYFAAGIRVLLGVALLFAAPTSRAPGLIFILGVAIIAFGLANGLLAISPYLALAAVAGVATGVTASLFVTASTALLQQRCAPAMRGRVMALAAIVYPSIVAILPTFAGGILGVLSLYMTGNIMNKFVVGKNIQNIVVDPEEKK